MKRSIIYLTCASLSACATQQQLDTVVEPVVNVPASDARPNMCNIFESSKWQAWLDKDNADGGLRLKVIGEVVLPSPGYSVDWQMGPQDRAFPPSLRLRLTTQAPPPGQGNIQVLHTQMVDFTIASPVSEYRSIILLCGDRVLGEIPDVIFID